MRLGRARGTAASGAPQGYPADLESEFTLQDGRDVVLRPILPSDIHELRRAVERADPETLRRRFLGGRPPRTDQEFTRLVHVDYDRRLAVVALTRDGEGVGIARYEAQADTDTAEVAVAVDPDWRHVGLATALLRLLAAAAITNGIHEFSAEFFADNRDVAGLLAEAGEPVRSRGDGTGVISAALSLPTQVEVEG